VELYNSCPCFIENPVTLLLFERDAEETVGASESSSTVLEKSPRPILNR
jgi:hypothetical protein